MENTPVITVFILFDKLPFNIAQNNHDGFGLFISTLRENTLLPMSNTFL